MNEAKPNFNGMDATPTITNKQDNDWEDNFRKQLVSEIYGAFASERNGTISKLEVTRVVNKVLDEALLAQTVKEERNRLENEFGDFAHEHYKGCTREADDTYTYGYDYERKKYNAKTF